VRIEGISAPEVMKGAHRSSITLNELQHYSTIQGISQQIFFEPEPAILKMIKINSFNRDKSAFHERCG